MIQYNNYKRFYAETGLFTLTGSNYEGYVETLSGQPYVSSIDNTFYNKCVSNTVSTKTPLERLPTFKTDLLCSVFFTDRYISDQVKLPYSINEILIEPNDFLNYGLLESKLSKLNINTTYTYSRCSLPVNKLPYSFENVKYAGTLSPKDNALSILSGYQDIPSFSSNLNYIDLGDIKGFTVVNNIDDDNISVIFAYSDTKLISLSCDNTNMSVIEVSPYYVSNKEENILKYTNIGGLVCVGTNLFITDSGANTILKYDISGYINNDRVLANTRNLMEIMGGTGKAKDELLFNTPTLLTSNGKNIVVYDSGNYVLKIYDTDFNFVTRIGSINLRSEKLASLEYNRLTNILYIATYYNDTIKLYVIDESYNISEIYILNIELKGDETVNSLEFSINDSNYFYICTSFAIYKFLVNRPDKVIGRFASNRLYSNARSPDTFDVVTDISPSNANDLWNYVGIPFNEANYLWNVNNGNTDSQSLTSLYIDTYTSTMYNDNYKGLRLTSQHSNTDKLFIITVGRIYYFNEANKLNTILKLSNFENFGNTFTLNKSEYIQGSTINKEFYKIVRDILELKNNIVGRFTGGYDSRNIFRYTDYNYNIDFSEIYNETSNDYFIHDNEKNILGVFNRVITQLYTIQEQLITLTDADRGDEISPVFNFGTTDPSNVLIIE